MIIFAIAALLTVGLIIGVNPDSIVGDRALSPYLLATGAMAMLVLGEILWLRKKGSTRELLLHPPIYMTGWAFFMICVPGLISFFDPDLLNELADGVPISYPYATYGMILFLAGLMFLWIGYIFGLQISRPAARLTKIPISEIGAGPLLALYGMTLLVRLIRISITGFSFGTDVSALGSYAAFSQWLGYIEDSRWLVLAILATRVFRGQWKPFPFAVITGIELVYAFTSGFMKPMLWLVMIVFMIATYCGVRLRRYVPLFITGVCLAVLVVPVTEVIRLDFSMRGGPGFDARDIGAIFRSTVDGFASSWGQGFGAGWDLFEKKMLTREAIVAHSPGVVVSTTPTSIPYEGFAKLLTDIPGSVIPRAIWAEKPELTRGVWFSHAYLNIPEAVQTSSAPTIVAEAYWYHGWEAVIPVMLALGVFLALLFKNTVAAGLVPLYVSLVPNLDVEGQFTIMILMVTERFIIGLFTIWVLVTISRALGSRTAVGSHAPPNFAGHYAPLHGDPR